MSLKQLIFAVVKDVVRSYSPSRSLVEGFVRYDFKLGEARKSLMQISFSALAAWPLGLILFIIWLNPPSSIFSLQKLMSSLFDPESEARLFLLDGQVSTMVWVASFFFVMQWILRYQYLWIAIIFFFLKQSEMHIHLALAGVIGVFFSHAFYLWWVRSGLVSQTRRLWSWVIGLQFSSTILVSIGSLILLDQYQRMQYFAGSLSQNRFLFLLSVVFSFYFFQFLFQTIWGHFYFQKKTEPSFMPVHFSTIVWLGRLKVRKAIENELKVKTLETLKHHQASVKQLKEMKDQSPGIRMGALEDTLNKELAYLQRVASRLTTD